MLDHPFVVASARIGGVSVVLFVLFFWFRVNTPHLSVLVATIGGFAMLYGIIYLHHEFIRSGA